MKISAWILLISVSFFPDALLVELTGGVPTYFVWVKVGLVFGFIALSFLWKDIRPLRPYALVIGVLYLSFEVAFWIGGTPWYQNMLNDMTSSSARLLLGKLLFLIPTAIMILSLLVLHRRWERFFFAKGDSTVDTEPVPLLGMRAEMSVRTLAAIVVLLFLVNQLLGFLVRGEWPSLSTFLGALPLLPIAISAALLNSFNEEVMFRVSLLSASHNVLGKRQAIWMAAVFFGSAHYASGSPLLYFVIITTALGWALGKVMLESRSILLPWAMHFALNSLQFSLRALRS